MDQPPKRANRREANTAHIPEGCDLSSSTAETQNSRTVGLGRDLWESSSPRQDHPERVTQGHVQVSLGCLQKERLHSLPGLLLQSSATLRGRKFFLVVRWNSCFN